MIIEQEYMAPEMELLAIAAELLVCTSPENGGHEGVEYEDWL